MKSNIIAQGAEAILIRENNKLIKRRIPKSYRLPALDEKLRKQRTRKEAKLLEKASKLIPVPNVLKSSDKTMEILMPFIEGKKLSDSLDSLKNASAVCIQIGENMAKLHDADIIHGDLTTSNMILVENQNTSQQNIPKSPSPAHQPSPINNSPLVFFIDFGLGFESQKIEDKAVDIHLIKQALEAKHFKNYESFFSSVLEGYKLSKNHLAVLNRLKKVEARGRYKQAC